MPRKNLIIIIVILVAAALGMDRAFSQDKYYKEMEIFSRIMHEVLNNYVTEQEAEKLFEGAYRGMLGQLDPYSQYFTQKQNRSFASETDGRFGGLGIEISISQGILTIIAPMRGTPAYEAGILAGDVILEIDGKSTERITLNEAVNLLRGKPGEPVTLTIRHPGALVDSKITIKRAIIKPPSVEYEMMNEKAGIGYMRVSTFSARVMQDLREAAKELKKQNCRGLILDLRQNPGGLLNVAVEMCDEFLEEGVIVSVKGRRPEQNKAYRAQKGDMLEDMPVVLLVDEGSASASEIVAGCLRDRKRGLIVGARTYGKGSVQNIIPLNAGQAIKLTTARYYTPDDLPILDHQGVFPDVPVPMTRDHLIALRNQEREDKMRGAYHLTGSIQEFHNGAEKPVETKETPEKKEEKKEKDKDENAPKDDKQKDADPAGRRRRVVDYQLKSAYNILRWQVNGGKLVE